ARWAALRPADDLSAVSTCACRRSSAWCSARSTEQLRPLGTCVVMVVGASVVGGNVVGAAGGSVVRATDGTGAVLDGGGAAAAAVGWGPRGQSSAAVRSASRERRPA